jgi:hypothetical protein
VKNLLDLIEIKILKTIAFILLSVLPGYLIAMTALGRKEPTKLRRLLLMLMPFHFLRQLNCEQPKSNRVAQSSLMEGGRTRTFTTIA